MVYSKTMAVWRRSRVLAWALRAALALEGGAWAEGNAARPPTGERAASASSSEESPVHPEVGRDDARASAAASTPKPRKLRVQSGARADKSARRDGPVVTFPAFEPKPNGGSRIFVELTAPVAVEKRTTDHAVIYTLKGAQVPSRNNRNPLITTSFAGPVARVQLTIRGADVDLVIALRDRVQPVHRMVTEDGGGARLEVDFPATAGGPAASSAPIDASDGRAGAAPADGSNHTAEPKASEGPARAKMPPSAPGGRAKP